MSSDIVGAPSTPGPTVITVDGVSKQFRLQKERIDSLKERVVAWRRPRTEEFWALKDVSLHIEKGMTYGLVGHNGSGKSTLLRLMAGIHRPTDGRVEVVMPEHPDFDDLPDLDRGVG